MVRSARTHAGSTAPRQFSFGGLQRRLIEPAVSPAEQTRRHSGVSRASQTQSHSARKHRSMRPLRADEGYRLWAPSYSDETAISYLEDKLVSAMTPPLAGMRLLDAGCGTGRRARTAAAAKVVALEPSREMAAAGIAQAGQMSGVEIVIGDVRRMPLPDRSFD